MDPVLVVTVTGLVLMGIERLAPGVSLPTMRGWWLRAFCITAVQASAVYLGAHTWDR